MVTALFLGYLSAQSRSLSVITLGLIAAASLTLANSPALSLLALPVAFGAGRISGGGLSISFADTFVLIGAFTPFFGLPRVVWSKLIPVMAALVAYEATIALSVILSPNLNGAVEVAHRAVIIFGSLLIGAYLAQRGRIATGIWLTAVTAAIIGIAAVADAVAQHFSPAFPFGLNKNYAGGLLAATFLLSMALEAGHRYRLAALRSLQVLMLLGVLATQSRGAMAGIVGGLVVWSFLARRHRRLVLVLILVLAPLLARNVIDDYTQRQFGSAITHVQVAQDAINEWQASPYFGNGIRFFLNGGGRVLEYDPHDVLLLTLAESGVAGLVGLVVLLGTAIRQLVKLDSTLARMAVALLVARLLHGMVDIYWVHGFQELPWVAVGMALSAAAMKERDVALTPATPREPNQVRGVVTPS